MVGVCLRLMGVCFVYGRFVVFELECLRFVWRMCWICMNFEWLVRFFGGMFILGLGRRMG